MKRFLAFLLALVMLSSLAVGVLADSSIVRDGNAFYAESNEVSQSELYAAFQSYYEGTSYEDLAKAVVKSAKRITLARSESYTTTIVDGSFKFVLDNTTDITDSDEMITLTPGKHTVSVYFAFHSDYSYKNLLGKTITGSYDGVVDGSAKDFTFSVRLKTELTLARSSASFVWGTEDPEQVVLNAVRPTVALANGTPLDASEVYVVEDLAKLDVGQYTVTVKYPGADNGDEPGYMPATAQVALTISKASTAVEVVNSTVAYDGKEHMVQVNVTPDTVPYTAITVGIQGDASGFASIYMSEGNALYNALVFIRNTSDALNYLTRLIGIDISDFVIGSEGVTLAQLRSLLTNITKLSTLLAGSGINLEESQISGILQALETVEKIMPDLNVTFYIANMPKNEGLYGTCAVATDENHNTALGFGYTTITPSFNTSIKWNQSTADHAFTMYNVGDFDFTAYVTTRATEEAEETVIKDAVLNYTFTGFTADGKLFNGTGLENAPTMPGTYTETAYSLYNYVATGTRIFTIARDAAFVKFVGENGELVDSVSLTADYDGQGKSFTAVVVDENGNVIEGAEVTYSYTGTTNSGSRYSSSTAPSNSGSYTVKASFAGDALYAPASNNQASITIVKPQASITFDNVKTRILQKVDYSSVHYTYEGMTADEAARIAATLGCGSRIHLLIGTHNMSVTIPDDIAAKYDVTVNGGRHTVTLFGLL